jgi:hypothetical protein
MTATRGCVAGAGTDFGPLGAIQDDYPAWRPWRSDHGGYVAVRRQTRWPADPPPGFAMTVCADTPGKLREALADQEARAVPD